MKKIKIQAAIFSLIVVSLFGVASIANAADSSLYVSPASKTVKVGDVISGSVGISAGGNKIYAVEGTLVFNRLSCQSVSVASGLQALTTPTCDAPKFILGIPSGSSADKALLTVSTKASAAGTAVISISGVKIVGGEPIKTISTSAGSGNYTVTAVAEVIKAVVEPKPAITPTKTITPTKPVNETANLDASAETPAVETSSVEIVTPPIEQGTVLAGFEQETPKEANWYDSVAVKVIAGIIVLILIVIVGFKFGKKK